MIPKKKLLAAFEDANSLCRSALSIAERQGLQTNWDAFQTKLRKSLGEQHKLMYPQYYKSDDDSASVA